MKLLFLAFRSVLNRKSSTFLTVVTIAVSVALFIGIDRIQKGVEDSFKSTLSGTDLIVGARSGSIQLLLYTVFRLGDPVNNITWQTYKELSQKEDFAWTVPISLGDSHRGFRVVGTTQEYFDRYQFRRDKKLEFASGERFSDVFGAVLGYEVAEQLDYKVGQKIILSHGIGESIGEKHENRPFTIVGILKKSGTPVDRSVHISLQGFQALHVDWQEGIPPSGDQVTSAEEVLKMDLTPKYVTSFLVGLKSKFSLFRVQREIDGYSGEAMMAVMPGASMAELWKTIRVFETTLKVISLFVIVAGFMGLMASLISTLNERRREMAILRSLGCRPSGVFGLLLLESISLILVGSVMGILLISTVTFIGGATVESHYGISLPVEWFTGYDLKIVGAMLSFGLVAGSVPAWSAYRNALSDGLMMRT